MAGDPPGLELVLSLPREVKLPRAEVLPRAVSIPELSSCVARRSTSTIGPTESRSTAATCVFESPVWPLIESTRSFTCMPLREAMPRGSSAATMGCTTSSLVKKSRSKPSSYRTNRMPSLVSRSTLWSTTSRSARDGAGASSESLRRGVSTRRALEKSDAVGLLARSRRKVCLAAGRMISSRPRPLSASPSTQTTRSPICIRGSTAVSCARCASAELPSTMSTTKPLSSHTTPSPQAPRSMTV
mmetsp:Transcript_5233/g.17371  ORF Transcript_5233/g.17371 Transcript_5233/m.17371 type:complete len:243 (+) Transcript_5233:422-1150(+)